MGYYTDEELTQKFRNRESDIVERKRNVQSPAPIKQAICAFANDLPRHGKPGLIFIGQDDDGGCANLDIDAALLELLGGWRNDGSISPFPNMSVFEKVIDGCAVAVIEVSPSDNPPVRFDGRTWIRAGPRRALATPEEERRLTERRLAAHVPFDASGVQGASIEDLDLVRFQIELLPALVPGDVLAQNQRSVAEQLASLRLTSVHGVPTPCGLLLTGKAPQVWFPGAYVQFLRIDGAALTDPIIRRHEITGGLTDQIRRLDELIALNVQTKSVVGGTVRKDLADVPEVALRQLIRNAVLHRTYEGTNAPVRLTWYSDRVEIQSPGGPFGQVTAANFGKPGLTDYRNPTLAQLLLRLGAVERFGIGLQLARSELDKNGNPPLELSVDDQHVLAVVRRNLVELANEKAGA